MQRSIPKTSKEAFHDPKNREKRKTTKELILDWLEPRNYENGYSIREIAKGIGKSYSATQKRVSDLYHEGRIIAIGSQREKRTPVTTYAFISREIQKVRKSKLQIWEEVIKEKFPLIYPELKEIVEAKFINQ